MELREMNVATDAEETAELLPAFQRDEEIESYFIEYAIQKEVINRNRSSSSRRLLSQAAHLTDHSSSNSNQKEDPCAGISFIQVAGPNWPPSRKREEAQALENLRKRVEQSKLCKVNPVTDPGGSASTSVALNTEQLQNLDNRPKLWKKIFFYGTMGKYQNTMKALLEEQGLILCASLGSYIDCKGLSLLARDAPAPCKTDAFTPLGYYKFGMVCGEPMPLPKNIPF